MGPCELCGGSDFVTHLPAVRDYISDETFAIRRCIACGLCVTDPMPPDSQIARYYPPSRYRVERQKYSGGMRVKLRAGAVERTMPRGFRGRLLDLGCGSGTFALEMKRRGWDVAVTELDDAVLDRMRGHGMEAKSPADAMRDSFAAPFDVITWWHVLEHVERPMELTRWARANLKPGGVFQVTVPNLASWQAKQFAEHWLHLDVPRHRYHFTPATLKKMLSTGGFEIERLATFAFEYDVMGVLQSALNCVCTRPNVFFEKITGGGGNLPRRDVVLSYALTPPLAGLALAHCIFAWIFHRGATLTATARPKTAV